jgi:pantothenate kinase
MGLCSGGLAQDMAIAAKTPNTARYRARTPTSPVPDDNGMDEVHLSVDELVERARGLAEQGGRRLLGITGAPGAGKSTVARAVVEELGPELCALVPMDGFHLANVTLIAWGRRDRKGAWDTFDADGYVHLLRRLRDQTEEYVHAPDFYREIEESIGSARPVHRDVPLVVTEGNYLLSGEGAWPQVAGLLHETWYLDVDPTTRRDRLVHRHEQHGKTHAEAEAWTDGSDEANAVLIAATRDRADLVVTVR